MIMANKYLTDDELISAINHSSEPYIIIEGPDDVMIYRWILEDINCTSMLEPRNGCGGVKNIYNRRNEITNPKVVFICDKDTYVYTNTIPEKYKDILYTEGYSIENDLYQGKSFEKHYFRKEDKILFEKALNEFLRYYACELEKFKNSKDFDFTKSPESILSENYLLDTSKLTDYKEPSQSSVEYIRNDYDLLLRGHSLFHLVRMIVGRKERIIKYSQKHLYDMCYCLKSNSIIKMQNRIKELLS